MSGTPEGGRKAAAKTKELYGLKQVKQWGAENCAKRKHHYMGFKEDAELASRAGAKGGGLGHRHRTINAGDPLRDEEWAVILKLVNRACGVIRLKDNSIDAIEQHNIYHKVFELWEKQDWVTAMTKVSSHPEFQVQFYTELVKEYLYYTELVKGQSRRTPDREHLRIVRNIKAAYESIVKTKEE